MRHTHIIPLFPHSIGSTRAAHSTVREGVRIGLIIGAVTWLWLAGLDFVMREPFQTIQSLGGFVRFTLTHFSLCIGYGLAIMSAIHGSMKEPTVMLALIFCTILFLTACVVVTAILANVGVGPLPWVKFLLGSMMATVLTYALVSRDHQMRDLYRAATAYH